MASTVHACATPTSPSSCQVTAGVRSKSTYFQFPTTTTHFTEDPTQHSLSRSIFEFLAFFVLHWLVIAYAAAFGCAFVCFCVFHALWLGEAILNHSLLYWLLHICFLLGNFPKVVAITILLIPLEWLLGLELVEFVFDVLNVWFCIVEYLDFTGIASRVAAFVPVTPLSDPELFCTQMTSISEAGVCANSLLLNAVLFGALTLLSFAICQLVTKQ